MMPAIIRWSAIGGVGLLVCSSASMIGQVVTPQPAPDGTGIIYADFIVIMLTSVAVIVTVLAVIVGILAFIGWQSFHKRIKSEVAKIMDDGFKPNGSLHKMFYDQKNKAGVAGVEPIGSAFEAEARAESEGEGEY